MALAEVVDIQEQGNRTVTLRVREVFRGDPPQEVTIADPWTSCGVSFGTKRVYLTWFSKDEKGRWHAFSDRWTGANESADIAFARSVKSSDKGARIFGTAGLVNKVAFVVGGPPAMGSSLAGGVIVAEGASGRFESVVDKDGGFSVNDLPAGEYTIGMTNLPPNTSVDLVKVTIQNGGCAEVHLRGDTSGRVSGKVASRGRAVASARLFLIDRAQPDSHLRRKDAWLGEDGSFVFLHVPPGDYVLGFNIRHAPTVDVPYNPRYYPAADDIASAMTLHVAEGQQIENLVFDVGPEAQRRTVHVRVLWKDGSPAPNCRTLLRDREDSIGYLQEEKISDSSGSLALTGFVGRAYEIDTYPECADESRRDASANIPASSADASAVLTLKGPKCELVVPKKDLDQD